MYYAMGYLFMYLYETWHLCFLFLFQRKLPEVGWSEIEIERLIRHFADMDSNNFPGLTTNNSIIFLLWKIIDFPGGHINDPLLG